MSYYALGTQDKITAMLCRRVAWIASTAKNHTSKESPAFSRRLPTRLSLPLIQRIDERGQSHSTFVVVFFVGRKPERNLHTHALPILETEED